MKYSANSVWENKDEYDIAVIGAGHAGCEAALAAARMGFKTVVFTVSVESIAMMPCNQKDQQYIHCVPRQIRNSTAEQ